LIAGLQMLSGSGGVWGWRRVEQVEGVRLPGVQVEGVLAWGAGRESPFLIMD